MASRSVPAWLAELVSTFGSSCKDKLAGPGDREAAIRTPIEQFLAHFGKQLGLRVVPYDEVPDRDRSVRPDYAISVAGVITGYVEIKKPGHSIDPSTFRGHDRRQWERQKDLPNLLYTNGIEWRLWRDGEEKGTPAMLVDGPLDRTGDQLQPVDDRFESLVTEFLRWKPAPITSVTALVAAIAPLTRLLRSEVLDQLTIERQRIKQGKDEYAQPFLGLARDWRSLLFPQARDSTFADGYAQTVTFALLLARSEGIDLSGASLHDIGRSLGEGHSLMGRALQLLTDSVAEDFKVTLNLLLRVVGSVNWQKIRGGKRDTYLYLYEHFLDTYDPELRKASGSYYTPREVVEQMVRLVEDVLITRLNKTGGFGDSDVMTVDPAMGTGTYLHTIIERVAEVAAREHGPGVASGIISDFAKRIAGFELQTGPYAVAELRTTDLLRKYKAKPPQNGMRSYVTNTLDDPFADTAELSSSLSPISASRRRANEVKARTPVTVVIGNPPYRERAEGLGGWIEAGEESARNAKKRPWAPLDDFRAVDNGQAEYVLKNLYVYFWRWATWKVFDAHPTDQAGVVCFITTSGYLRGAGFKGMREYLRRTTSEGWIIDVSPEGHQPDVATRVFPGVQQPLAIALFVRHPDTDTDTPAHIRHTRVSGRRADKYTELTNIDIDEDYWRDVRSAWQAPFTPAAESAWDEWPALNDIFPWTSPGVKPNRTWVYSPAESVLIDRWRRLITEPDTDEQKKLFKDSRDSSLEKTKRALPGSRSLQEERSLKHETEYIPDTVRTGQRAFDRQYMIADHRVIDQSRPPLWSARLAKQVFTIEQSAEVISDGPGIVFSALIPDMHHFNNRGGRVLPLLHPDGAANIAPKLCDALTDILYLESSVTAEDIIAYIAGVVSHPGFTVRFSDELATPGIRVPITLDAEMWRAAVEVGREVIWLHTYGEAFHDNDKRPSGNVRYVPSDNRQPKSISPVTEMADDIEYDDSTETVRIGDGSFGPVSEAVWEYTVGGKNVIRSWFNYRKHAPGGKKTSPLDDMHLSEWPAEWTIDFIDLLTVLTRLVDLEDTQERILQDILHGKVARAQYLRDTGVRWPTRPKDRAVRYPMTLENEAVDEESPGQQTAFRRGN